MLKSLQLESLHSESNPILFLSFPHRLQRLGGDKFVFVSDHWTRFEIAFLSHRVRYAYKMSRLTLAQVSDLQLR